LQGREIHHRLNSFDKMNDIIQSNRKTESINQDFFPIKTFHPFHKDANINYQLNRFLIAGLEDVYAEIGSHVKNLADWKKLFCEKAAAYEKEGNTDYAMGLYRAAEFFMNPSDPDRTLVIEKFLRFFYQSKAGKNLKQMSVPYENNHLHGFKLTPSLSRKGIILIHGGFDSYIEEFYTLGAAFCEKGYEVILFDGPGQGSTLMFEKIPMTHEWEKPIAAVLDYIGEENVTLIGISLGGYLAIRAASLEKRIYRVIADDVMLDFFACVTSRRGKVAAYLMRGLIKLRLAFVFNAVAGLMMKKDMYSQWGIAQGMHVMGCKTPYEFFLKLKQYNGYTVSAKITGDVLIMAGIEDHFVPMTQFYKQLALLTGAKSVTGRIFTKHEQAQSHCQIGNLGLAANYMLGWIEEHT
jgi:pimeloyl-ACP methyl ester carboxylesterase